MWTAKIQNKALENEQMVLTVLFTDGEKTLTETCKPQDEVGFQYWIDARLKSLNGSEVFKTAYEIGETVEVKTPQVPVATVQDVWMSKFYRLQQVQKLVDLGIVPNDNPKVVALRNDLRTTLKLEYIDTL
jgi:hypothetical protein